VQTKLCLFEYIAYLSALKQLHINVSDNLVLLLIHPLLNNILIIKALNDRYWP